jgi:alpha-1,3-rhamnosyltransferase
MQSLDNVTFCDDYVTVVALCYNQSRFLAKTLDSIMAQSWRPQKFYIIDDCSTDDSVEKINEWLDANGHPATLIRHEQNWGITRTMNHALSLCNTKYFHPWPCDDLLMPDKIESQVRYLESLDWEPGFLYGDIQWIDEDDIVFRESLIADRRKLFPNGEMPSGNIFPQLVKLGCFIPTASGFYVTKALKDLGGFDEKLFAEDWDMFMRIALKNGIAFKNQVFSQYRRHRHSAEMAKGERYWDGNFKILPRYLGTSKEYDNLIYEKLCGDAIEAYKHKYTKAIGYVLKNALRRKDVRLLYIYLRMRLQKQPS